MNSSFLQQGKGKDLVFLHGYLSSKESFYPQINYFSRHFRVTAPDLPGSGERHYPCRMVGGEYADWLEGFLKEQASRSLMSSPILSAAGWQ